MQLDDIPAIYLVDKFLVAAQGTIFVHSYSSILQVGEIAQFCHEEFINGITPVLLIRVVDLCTFSHGSNPNTQGGCFTLMWLVAFSYVISVL